MNIKQVEKATGITKQNIRFYEKQGLLKPARNTSNEYREYQEKDIHDLKIIKVLRKLGMPIAEIKQVMDRTVSLSEAVNRQQERLKQEKANLEAAIRCCEKIAADTIDTLSVEENLQYMEAEEKKGGHFVKIWNDFLQVAAQEEQNHFSFMPDTMIGNAREFTDELLKYANENNINMVITKESMYPEFTIDDMEYKAERIFGRFGAVVHCTRKKAASGDDRDSIEQTEATGQTKEIGKKGSIYYRILRLLYKSLPLLFLFLYFAFVLLMAQDGNKLATAALAILLAANIGAVLLFAYRGVK